MRKEIVYAVLAGSLLGLVIAFGVWRVNSALNKGNSSGPAGSPSPTPLSELGLTIAKPENESVSIDGKVTISGLTRPTATLVISAEEEDYLIPVNEDGTFKKEIDLIGGVNQILVTSFDASGRSIDEKLTIVYSSEFAKNIKTPVPEETPSTATDNSEIREKVQQKVEEAMLNPKAYLGTVTDIIEDTLQIKSGNGEIKQVSIADEAAIVKIGKTNKDVKAEDIAIGDYIVAMGFPATNGSSNGKNGVLEGQRILIMSAPGSIARKIIVGNISDINKSDVVLSSLNEENTVSLVKTTVVYQLEEDKLTKSKTSDLDTDNRIIVVGEKTEKSFDARTIFIMI
jgi:hypothetical protein